MYRDGVLRPWQQVTDRWHETCFPPDAIQMQEEMDETTEEMSKMAQDCSHPDVGTKVRVVAGRDEITQTTYCRICKRVLTEETARTITEKRRRT